MKKQAKLKPCPFCGSEYVGDWEDEDEIEGRKFFYVRCWKCTARGEGRLAKKRAIEAWNRRAA